MTLLIRTTKRCYILIFYVYVCAPPNRKFTAAASSSSSIWQWRFSNVINQLILFPFFCCSFVCLFVVFRRLFFVLLFFFIFCYVLCAMCICMCVCARFAFDFLILFSFRGCNLPVWIFPHTHTHTTRLMKNKFKIPNNTMYTFEIFQ